MTAITTEFLAQLSERLPGCDSILVVGSGSVPEGDAALKGPVPFSSVLQLEFKTRFDLGLVFDPTPQHAPAISRLRDLGCRRVLILGDDEVWRTNELRALGFMPIDPFDDRSAFIYDSDLLNQPREWNNSKHWANPENFDKYRW